MIKRTGGTWVSGTLDLFPSEIRFTQSKPQFSRAPAAVFSVSLTDVSDIEVRPGFGAERLVLHTGTQSVTFMVARAADFVAQLRQRVS